MKKYTKIICMAAAVCLLGAAAFCGFRIYSHYAHESEQEEVFEKIAEVVEQAQTGESETVDVLLTEEETVLAEWASYEKLLQEGEYSKENKEKPSFSGAIYTAYWVIATAVYLGYSLSSNNWGQSWIIWVVAGVIFPAVIAITNAFEKKSK